jgi:hypothetical protein
MFPDSLRRKIIYNIAILPFLGRNIYERLNSRLDRQIKIREEKRNSQIKVKKTKHLFPQYHNEYSTKKLFFDA